MKNDRGTCSFSYALLVEPHASHIIDYATILGFTSTCFGVHFYESCPLRQVLDKQRKVEANKVEMILSVFNFVNFYTTDLLSAFVRID
ncbi:CLUMA_CG016032, isoform A [Clunio marinus]|uniref:CLUMA_CG016032, isoform A n=1 Tax=Clunio marinus TaxID=568069 RepID=A0A1J1IVP0_9DIPT|nr:CLUMA_CG016032, isoform A [Clunio marinus]